MNIATEDKLDVLIALAAKSCGDDDVEAFDRLDDSAVVFDKQFYRKRDRIIRRLGYSSAVLAFRKGFVRVAVAILVLMSLAFTTIMAIPTFREALFDAVVEWYENYLTVQYKPDNEETKGNSIVDAPAITPPTEIEEIRKPTNLPEGMVEDIILQNNSTICIDYYLNNEWIYAFRQMVLNEDDKYIDSKTAIIATVDINGNIGTIIRQDVDLNISIVWTDNEYVYSIYTCNENIEQLIAFARSVELGELHKK